MNVQANIYTIAALVTLAYVAGFLTYWQLVRRNLRILKRYRIREQVLRQWDRPVE